VNGLAKTIVTTIALTFPLAAIAGDSAQVQDTNLPRTTQELREKIRQSLREVKTLRDSLAKGERAHPIAKDVSRDKKSGGTIIDVPDGCYYFYAKSVAPCQRMMPTIDRMLHQGFRIVKVNIGPKADLSKQYKITAIPTILIKSGPRVVKLTGVQDEQSLRSALLQNHIKDEAPSVAKENRAEALVLLVYPVGDLLSKSELRNGVMRAEKPDFDPLLHMIVNLIEPESWDETGGTGGIKPVEKTLSLVIRQTPRVHAQIRILLDELRKLEIEDTEKEQ
jgi:thiol-disulfide isomerase/thioredoxin